MSQVENYCKANETKHRVVAEPRHFVKCKWEPALDEVAQNRSGKIESSISTGCYYCGFSWSTNDKALPRKKRLADTVRIAS